MPSNNETVTRETTPDDALDRVGVHFAKIEKRYHGVKAAGREGKQHLIGSARRNAKKVGCDV